MTSSGVGVPPFEETSLNGATEGLMQYTEQSGEIGPFAGVSPESKITTLVRAGFRAYRQPPAIDCTPHQECPHDGSRNWAAGTGQPDDPRSRGAGGTDGRADRSRQRADRVTGQSRGGVVEAAGPEVCTGEDDRVLEAHRGRERDPMSFSYLTARGDAEGLRIDSVPSFKRKHRAARGSVVWETKLERMVESIGG
ncbi:hypothetical protein CSOJ01_04479 [Colletotrichum sojae]|uniref:Uncharacterized protein n=1 Tax=Colletotrichum sojae TaxID=2175907 RepID=A0A8H6MZ92_9PEZI|nr:hypothetical protein CSOJ01_04479 [Colletotrichum sojae]